MADNDNGGNNVAIIAILIIALLAIGGFLWAQGFFSPASEKETTVIEREIIREEPAQEPAPAQEEDDSDFSFEFEDEEGNKTSIEGDGGSE